MLHSRQNNKKIKHLHERSLRLIQNDELPSYQELLEKDGSVSVRHRNIQSLSRYRNASVKHGQCREIATDILHRQHRSRMNFRKNQEFSEYSVSWF